MENPSQKKRLYEAIEWLKANPSEKSSTAAQIYNLNPSHLHVTIVCLKRKPHIQSGHGGQNKILSEAQSEAVIQYIQD